MGPVFKNVSVFFTVFISLYILIGCSSLRQPAHPIDYYTLEYSLPAPVNPVTLPVILMVEKFQISPVYNSNSMVYRENPEERNAYAYYKWRANPSDLVSYFITRDLDQSSLFEDVVSLNTNLIPTHILDGTVDEFFEDDQKDSWYAVLSMRISLIKNSGPDAVDRVLLQKKYHHTEKCSEKNPQAVAAAMSRNMAAVSSQIINDIYDRLKKTVQ